MFQQLNHDIGRVFDLMSPSTLAALITDIQQLGKGADSAALDIERAAREALDGNCGQDDAARYLAAAGVTDDLLSALINATERMEAVASGIPVRHRHKGVSQATHVAHMAGHLQQHAKIARAAIAKATGNAKPPCEEIAP